MFAFERVFRGAFRMVGYGYRPGPAFLTWIATAATGLLYAWLNGDPANANEKLAPIAFGWPMLAKLGEFMFLPIGYLRLANTSDTLVLTPTIPEDLRPQGRAQRRSPKLPDSIAERDPNQAWYWTPEWQEGEEQIELDRATGRFGPVFDSADEFLDALQARYDGACNPTVIED